MSIYLSASSIADYIKCQQKVLYRFTKPFPEVFSKDATIGKIVHLAIEKHWNDRTQAIELVKQESKKYGLYSADRNKMEYQLDLFFLNFAHRLQEDDLIEYHFKFPLYDDVSLVGKIDRISNGNLYDWKTGIVSKYLGGDVQCIIYEYAYQKIFGKDPTSINLGALASGQLVPYVRNELAIKEVFENVIPNMIRTVRNGTYYRQGIFNHSCYRCPFKIGCLGNGGEENVLDSGVTPE